jgi:integrase/recombinase XerD
VKDLQGKYEPPGVKQQLAAERMLFDWLITGQIVPTNPASAVRGPKHFVKTGKTPVLEGDEWPKLFLSIPTTTLRDLRDRALIATLTYSFARIGAALKMKVEDLRPRAAGWAVRLHEKGGKEHAMPCHHALAEALRAYIDAAGIAEDRKGWLFRTARGHKADTLSDRTMNQSDAWCMIRRRAKAAGIAAEIGCHSFRATGITAYLANGGALEHAQEMAAHESPRTTNLYDRRKERLTQDEIERIRFNTTLTVLCRRARPATSAYALRLRCAATQMMSKTTIVARIEIPSFPWCHHTNRKAFRRRVRCHTPTMAMFGSITRWREKGLRSCCNMASPKARWTGTKRAMSKR